MLNKIVLMGRLTRDPELRLTTSGTAVASFSLAVDRDFKNKETGEKETDFIDIVAWRNTAEFVGKYFSKGRMAVVEGRLQIRPWTDKDGNKRRSAEVVADNVYFGDSKRDSAPGGFDQSYGQPGYGQQTAFSDQGYGQQVNNGNYQSPPMQYPQYGYGADFPIQDDDSDLPF